MAGSMAPAEDRTQKAPAEAEAPYKVKLCPQSTRERCDPQASHPIGGQPRDATFRRCSNRGNIPRVSVRRPHIVPPRDPARAAEDRAPALQGPGLPIRESVARRHSSRHRGRDRRHGDLLGRDLDRAAALLLGGELQPGRQPQARPVLLGPARGRLLRVRRTLTAADGRRLALAVFRTFGDVSARNLPRIDGGAFVLGRFPRQAAARKQLSRWPSPPPGAQKAGLFAAQEICES